MHKSPETLPQPRIFSEWSGLPDSERLATLEQIDESLIEANIRYFDSFLAAETDSVIAATLIEKFGGHLDDWQLCRLAPFVADGRYGVRLAALSVLMRHAPVFLAEFLPELLQTEDIGVRALAVRSLFMLDEPMAVRQLESMLLGRDPDARDLAIQNCFQLPFEKVRQSLLKALATEANPIRLKKIGLLFVTNPDTDSPFRLWAMLESVSGRRADFIRETLQATMKSLESSKILGDRFSEFQNRLQSFIDHRKVLIQCRRIIDHYNAAEQTSDPGFDEQVLAVLENSSFRKILISEAGKQENSQFRQHLARLQRSDSSEPATVTTTVTFAAADFDGLSEVEKHRTLARWPAEKMSEFRTVFGKLTGAGSKGSEHLAASGFRTALRIDDRSFTAEAVEALNSRNPFLILAGMEYLAEIDSELLLPYLAGFLQSQNRHIRILAIRILQKFDVEQVVANLRLALNSKIQAQVEPALAACFFLDFALVREIIAVFLASEPSDQQFNTGLYLFETNPGPASLPVLMSLEKSVSPERAQMIRDVRERCQKLMIDLGIWQAEKVCEHVETIRTEAIKVKITEPPPVMQVKAPPVRRAVNLPVKKREMLHPWFLRLVKVGFAVVFFVAGIGLSLKYDGIRRDRVEPVKQAVATRQPPMILAPIGMEVYVEGRVVADDGADCVDIEAPGMDLIRCMPWPPFIGKPVSGSLVQATVIPRRRLEEEGISICSLQSLKLSEAKETEKF